MSPRIDLKAFSKPGAADAEVSRRYLQLAQAELNVSYTVICSPVTGIVGKRNVETSQYVNIGQQLVDVVPVDDLWVTANFKQTQLAHMRPGQPVEIKVDAYGRKWNGRVTSWAAAPSRFCAYCLPKKPLVTTPKSCNACRCESISIVPRDRSSTRNGC